MIRIGRVPFSHKVRRQRSKRTKPFLLPSSCRYSRVESSDFFFFLIFNKSSKTTCRTSEGVWGRGTAYLKSSDSSRLDRIDHATHCRVPYTERTVREEISARRPSRAIGRRSIDRLVVRSAFASGRVLLSHEIGSR